MNKNPNKIKCIIYCRVSSKEQADEGYSLDSQDKLLKEYAEKHGFEVVKTYRISESASGKQVRKSFMEMMAYASKQRVSTVLCEKIDRLTRNLKDAAIVDDWVKEDSKREIHFLKENFRLNSDTKAHDNFIWDMKVAVARFYTNNLSEEVRKGQKEKIAQGGYPSQAKLGYKTIGEKGHKKHIPVEPKASLMREAFELYATGNYSLKALVETMYKKGLRNDEGNKVLKSRMHELLSDPFYLGKIRWNGEIYPGEHEALISKGVFDEVQAKIVRQYKNPQYKKHLPTFKAKITCGECGGTITWEIQKGHWYGHCNHYKACSQREYVRQENVEEQIFPLFDGVAPKVEAITKWLENAVVAKHANEINKRESMRVELNVGRGKIKRWQEKMYEDKLDGKITEEFYERKSREFSAEDEMLLSNLTELGDDNKKYYEAGYSIHELAQHAVEIYNSKQATTENRRMLLSYIFSDLKLNSRKISHNFTYGFGFLADWMPLVNKNFEPTKNPSINGASGVVLDSTIEAMAPEVQDNFEPQKTLILRHDLKVRPSNHDNCSAARTRTWNHLLNREPLYH